jgi:hypothetical protein
MRNEKNNNLILFFQHDKFVNFLRFKPTSLKDIKSSQPWSDVFRLQKVWQEMHQPFQRQSR